ncbi:MAG: type VI secretion system baseplate subunit TssG, partial [Casimicrobiaceae bacterium]
MNASEASTDLPSAVDSAAAPWADPPPSAGHPHRERMEALIRLLEDAACDVDFYVALRHLDAFSGAEAPLGRAPRPKDEPIRLSQYPSQIFAPSTLRDFVRDNRLEGVYGRLSVYHFGLFGPHGPLPGHITEYVQERLIHHRDETMLRFLDMFQHRMLLLFYRAWADCQSTVSLDRPGDDHFTRYVASLSGYGQPSLRNRDHVPDHWKFGLSGHLVRPTRNAEGLRAALESLLRVPVA